MRLYVGEPGSGKTTRIVEEIRARLSRGAADFRLLAPTSTMAEHLRNTLARGGALVRPSTVQTLAGFVEALPAQRKLASPTALLVLLKRILAETRPPAFAPMLNSPGLGRAVLRAIEDLANAGCGALEWSALRAFGIAPQEIGDALETVYGRLEEELTRRGLVLRTAQLAEAARTVDARSLSGVEAIYVDGFFSFSGGELALLEALDAHFRLTVTLPEWPGARNSLERLRALKARETRLYRRRAEPVAELTSAPTRQREVESVALRVLDERAAGRNWRDMGIIVRGQQPYEPLIQRTFARLGIPLRSYFAGSLGRHPVCRLLGQIVAAALSGWDVATTLPVVRSAVSASGGTEAADRLEYAAREAMPAQGLAALRGLTEDAAIVALLDELEPLTGWLTDSVTPQVWAERLSALLPLVAAPGLEPLEVLQTRAAAFEGFREVLSEVAGLLEPEACLLEGFWPVLAEALGHSALRSRDGRRDAVYLFDAHEARQWELPVVFVCGLLEGEFPRAIPGDPVLSEETRARLCRNGIQVPTRGDRDAEEQFLFRFALTRATERIALSWPEAEPDGKPTLRAFALDELGLSSGKARPLRVRPSLVTARAARPRLGADDVLEPLRSRHSRMRVTALEHFLQCPFQFFSRDTLELEETPKLPAERLDALAQGTLAHAAIAAWHSAGGSMDDALEREWLGWLQQSRVPASHRLECSRLRLARVLREYEKDPHRVPGVKTRLEVPLKLRQDGVELRGRADRVDEQPDGGVVVYDFKYSSSNTKRNKQQQRGQLVQGGLYLAALEEMGSAPAGFHYVALKKRPLWPQKNDAAEAVALMEVARSAASNALSQIWQGEISVRPADAEGCQYCAFAQSCRREAQPAVEAAAD